MSNAAGAGGGPSPRPRAPPTTPASATAARGAVAPVGSGGLHRSASCAPGPGPRSPTPPWSTCPPCIARRDKSSPSPQPGLSRRAPVALPRHPLRTGLYREKLILERPQYRFRVVIQTDGKPFYGLYRSPHVTSCGSRTGTVLLRYPLRIALHRDPGLPPAVRWAPRSPRAAPTRAPPCPAGTCAPSPPNAAPLRSLRSWEACRFHSVSVACLPEWNQRGPMTRMSSLASNRPQACLAGPAGSDTQTRGEPARRPRGPLSALCAHSAADPHRAFSEAKRRDRNFGLSQLCARAQLCRLCLPRLLHRPNPPAA